MMACTLLGSARSAPCRVSTSKSFHKAAEPVAIRSSRVQTSRNVRSESASSRNLGVLERSGEWTGFREDRYHELLDKLFDLHGKVAVITGGAQGVGKAMAKGLARCGADLALLDLKTTEEIDQAVGDIFEATGKAPLSVSVDVRDKKAMEVAMQKVFEAHGKIDIVVANAGIMGKLERPEIMSQENFDAVLKTNVDGVFNTATAAYPYMKETGHGKVIVMSSIASFTGFGAQAAYCASKGALIPLAKSLAVAWAPDNIQVNCLLPGAVNTNFTNPVLGTKEQVEYILSRIPAGRLGVPEDFIGPCVFLASTASDYVTGATLVVDGGGTSVPMLGVNPTQIGKKG